VDSVFKASKKKIIFIVVDGILEREFKEK